MSTSHSMSVFFFSITLYIDQVCTEAMESYCTIPCTYIYEHLNNNPYSKLQKCGTCRALYLCASALFQLTICLLSHIANFLFTIKRDELGAPAVKTWHKGTVSPFQKKRRCDLILTLNSWDHVYEEELENFEDMGDEGEIWYCD
jgi:hypothetical protein